MGVQTNAPVIIKKKKVVGGDGHHGGAWKVAYADFVTAMMAFFLLMWLLNATTEKQRKGIADYFSPTIPINRISGGGDGAFGGDSIFSEETLAQNGTGSSRQKPTTANRAKGDTGVTPSENAGDGADADSSDALTTLEEMLAANSGESMMDHDLLRHIVTRRSNEGLVIELRSGEEKPLFDAQNEPTALMVALTEMLARVLNTIENDIAVVGHMRAKPVVHLVNDAWRASIDRADRIRADLEQVGLGAKRITTIRGHGSMKPATSDPMANPNDRIEVIVLR